MKVPMQKNHIRKVLNQGKQIDQFGLNKNNVVKKISGSDEKDKRTKKKKNPALNCLFPKTC